MDIGHYCPFSTSGGVGRFGVGSEGAVLLRSVTARVSTAGSTALQLRAAGSHSSPTQCSLLIYPRRKKNVHNEQRATT